MYEYSEDSDGDFYENDTLHNQFEDCDFNEFREELDELNFND